MRNCLFEDERARPATPSSLLIAENMNTKSRSITVTVLLLFYANNLEKVRVIIAPVIEIINPAKSVMQKLNSMHEKGFINL